ncbi:MAG: hypothetical protein C5B47_04340 [Verrucomicrobia bacterium]|nr:MAG: hypothetical protein C5B47_04340 [Verrucomicrobiota bacterium]
MVSCAPNAQTSKGSRLKRRGGTVHSGEVKPNLRPLPWKGNAGQFLATCNYLVNKRSSSAPFSGSTITTSLNAQKLPDFLFFALKPPGNDLLYFYKFVAF